MSSTKIIADNSSFRNSLRRVKGAIVSGKRAAYLGMGLKLLKPITHRLDHLIGQFNSTAEMRSNDTVPPILMIVSPPRSGSTMIYQVLTRVIPSVYYSNFHFLFPLTASQIMQKFDLFGRKLHGFKNYYGYTPRMHDVNEGNDFMHRIFNSNITAQIRENFLTNLDWIRGGLDLPFIFKNVRYYSKISLIHQAIPEIIFLRIKREIAAVVKSELKGFESLGTFHPIPAELKETNISDPVEFCVRQILSINESIDLQKKEINPDSWIEWEYESFCEDPQAHILPVITEKLHMNQLRLRWDNLHDNLKASNYAQQELQDIQKMITWVNSNK